VQGVGNLGQRHEVILHVLAGGDVAFPASVEVGDLGEVPHLIGGEQAAGNLGANHMHRFLALAVDAAAQAEGAELVGGEFAGGEGVSLGAEQFDVRANGLIVLLCLFFF